LKCQIGLNANGPRFRDKVIVFWQRNPFYMFFEYIQAAISKAVYEVIDDEEPKLRRVPDLEVAIENWIAFILRFNLPIPVIERLP